MHRIKLLKVILSINRRMFEVLFWTIITVAHIICLCLEAGSDVRYLYKLLAYLLAVVSLMTEMLSEAVKILKGEYAVRAIRVHNMDKAIIFCRTKVDCDNMENYLNKVGGGQPF